MTSDILTLYTFSVPEGWKNQHCRSLQTRIPSSGWCAAESTNRYQTGRTNYTCGKWLPSTEPPDTPPERNLRQITRGTFASAIEEGGRHAKEQEIAFEVVESISCFFWLHCFLFTGHKRPPLSLYSTSSGTGDSETRESVADRATVTLWFPNTQGQ